MQRGYMKVSSSWASQKWYGRGLFVLGIIQSLIKKQKRDCMNKL